MFPFPSQSFDKAAAIVPESGQLPRGGMNLLQQLLLANNQYLATMALLRGGTFHSANTAPGATRLQSAPTPRTSTAGANRSSDMRRVGTLNVFAVRTPASTGATNNSTEFHAVLYDGERMMEAGDTLDVSDDVLPLCHTSASRCEANIAAADEQSTSPHKCKVLKRVQRGDELVRLFTIATGGALTRRENAKEPKKVTMGLVEIAAIEEATPTPLTTSGYQCERCGKMFSYEYYREKHLKYTRCVDNGDRKFPCPLCSRSFEKRDRLRIHVLHVHENHRPHACSICGKAFSQSSSLNKHLRVHSGERPYQCGFCSKAFTASSILRTHIRQHSGEKPFKCVHCGKSFASHAAHDSHVRRSHNAAVPATGAVGGSEGSGAAAIIPRASTSVGGWRCVICNKQFERQAQWNFHMKCFHPTDLVCV